jgi:hypothetical protein
MHFTIWESLCTGVPGKFQILTNMPLVYKNHPGKIGEPAIGSLGVDHRWPCRIPARWRPGLVGRGWGRTQGSPRGRFGWSDGAGRLRRAASAVPVSTDRRATSAGARLAWARKGAARAAPGGDRGREGGATLACGRPATGARRGWPQGRRHAARVRRGGPVRRGKRSRHPYRRPGGEARLQPLRRASPQAIKSPGQGRPW